MPRKSRKKAEPVSIAEVMDQIPSLKTASQLEPDTAVTVAEVSAPVEPTFVERIRPEGPRKRDGEPAASYASGDLRITLQDRVWQVESRRELTGEEKDRLAAGGFYAVDEGEERVWNASQRELAERGTDLNQVAFFLGGKAERLGRTR